MLAVDEASFSIHYMQNYNLVSQFSQPLFRLGDFALNIYCNSAANRRKLNIKNIYLQYIF